MAWFLMGLTTRSGVANSEFLDRLADRAYEVDALLDLTLGLNDDGSVTATFAAEGRDVVEAVEAGTQLFFDAFVAAGPSHGPAPGELEEAHWLAGHWARGFLTALSAEPSTEVEIHAVPV